MTTGIENAQPTNPADQQSQQPPVAPAETAQAAEATGAPAVVPDVDDLELNEAKAAAKAEETAAPGDEQQQTAPADGTQPPQPAVQPTEQRQPVPMVPKPRFDEALVRATKAEQAAAFWHGRATAQAATPAQPAGQQAPPAAAPETPEQKLAAIQTRQDDLAKKFDDGEITMAEYKRQERALQNDEFTIREEVTLSKVKPATAPAQTGGDELFLDVETGKLEQAHPWVGVFDRVGTDAEWGFLKQQAVDNLAARGVDIRNGSIGRYELRKEISQLCDRYGPGMVAARAQANGIAIPGSQQAPQPQPQPSAQPRLSPTAQARQTSLDLARNAPPDINRMNGVGADGGLPSDARLEAMSDEDIGALPVATRNRLLGITQ